MATLSQYDRERGRGKTLIRNSDRAERRVNHTEVSDVYKFVGLMSPFTQDQQQQLFESLRHCIAIRGLEHDIQRYHVEKYRSGLGIQFRPGASRENDKFQLLDTTNSKK